MNSISKWGLLFVLGIVPGAALGQGVQQYIVWNTPATNAVLLLGQAYPLAATASSGSPVTFRVQSGPAVITAGSITATNLGAVVVIAEQPGNAIYSPAFKSNTFNRTTGYLQNVAEWPGVPQGAASSVQVAGSYAYVGLVHTGLSIFDISNPANPRRVADYRIPSDYMKVHVRGSYAYLALGHGGLTILDVREPAQPVLVTNTGWELPAFSIQFADSGSLAWIASDPFLRAVDLSNPKQIVPIGSVHLAYCTGVKVVDTKAYAIGGFSGFNVVDVTDPANPIRLVAEDTVMAHGVAASGSRVYIADDQGLLIYDVSIPNRPTLLGVHPGKTYDVQLVGPLAYLATYPEGLQIVDVSNPTMPVLVGKHKFRGSAREVCVVGTRAYLVDFTGGLEIVETAEPSAPVRLGGYDTLITPRQIEVIGSVAYLSGHYGLQLQKMEAMDISNPSQPAPRPQALLGDALTIQLEGTRVYLGDAEAWLRIVDFTDPEHPVPLGSFNPAGLPFAPGFLADQRVERIRINGSRAYLANGKGGLQILDVSDPTRPTRVGGSPDYAFGSAVDVQVSGNIAYVAAGYVNTGGGLDILDVSDPSTIVRLGNFMAPGTTRALTHGVQVIENLAYLADNVGGLQIVDVSDPRAPRLVGSTPSKGVPYSIQVVGTRAFLACRSGVEVMDVSDPAHPSSWAWRVLPGFTYDLKVVNDYVFTASDSGGLQILKYQEGIPQTVEFPVVALRVYRGTRLTLTATASSRLPVTFQVLSGPATIVGNEISFNASGQVIVQAQQAGNAQVLPAESPRVSIFVDELPQLTLVGPDADGLCELQYPLESEFFILESTDALKPGAVWQPVASTVRWEGDRWVRSAYVQPDSSQRFFRLRL